MTELTITEHVEQLQKKYGSCNTCQGMYELGRHDEKTEKKSSEQKIRTNLYSMKLHEYTKIKEANLYVLRVPGGWLYVDNHGTCFVPLCKEFTNPVKYSKFEELTRRKHIDELKYVIANSTTYRCASCGTSTAMLYLYNASWLCKTCLQQLDLVDTTYVKGLTPTPSNQKTEKE